MADFSVAAVFGLFTDSDCFASLWSVSFSATLESWFFESFSVDALGFESVFGLSFDSLLVSGFESDFLSSFDSVDWFESGLLSAESF